MFGIHCEYAAIGAHEECRRVVVVILAFWPVGESWVQDGEAFSPAGQIIGHHFDISPAGRIANACCHRTDQERATGHQGAFALEPTPTAVVVEDNDGPRLYTVKPQRRDGGHADQQAEYSPQLEPLPS